MRQNRLFFLCHNSEDKPFVRRVAQRIGAHLCWVDEAEIKASENILDKIDHAIVDSKIFVIFWSKNSMKSPWVQEEISQARIRNIRDNGYRLVTIKLDETDLPNYLSFRLYLDIKNGLKSIVQGLKNLARDLSSSEVYFGSDELKDSFQNRDKEFDLLESLSFSEDFSGILILGLVGIGKTSFVKRASSKIFPHLTPIWVDLDIYNTPLRFLSALAKPLSISIDPVEVSTFPERIWKEKFLPEIAQSENLFIVLDNFVSIEHYTKTIALNLLNTIIFDLLKIRKDENPNLIIIASKEPDLKKISMARIGAIKIGELHEKHMTRGLRYHLKRLARDKVYSIDDLKKIVKIIHGYPLALGLVASQINQKGIDLVLADIKGLHGLIMNLVNDLMSDIELTQREKDALILISTAAVPINEHLRNILIGDNYDIIDSIFSKQLLDPSQPGIAVHSIIRSYILESVASPEQIKQAHETLSKMYKEEWKKAPDLSPLSAELGSLAYYHTISAGKESDAHIIKVAYKEETKDAAIELYRRGDYKTALTFLEKIRELDKDREPIIEFYYALALNKQNRSHEALDIIDTLVISYPHVSRYHHSKGTILRNLDKNDEAVKSFRKAVAASKRRDVVALSSLARSLCELGKNKEALNFAEEAYGLKPGDSQVINVLVQIYHEIGDDIKALSILEEAISRRTTDTRLIARAGMIAKDIGNLHYARDFLTKVSTNPSYPHTIIALADVYIKLGNLKKAEEILESYPSSERKDKIYWSTKANIHRLNASYNQALECINKALRFDPKDPVILGGAAQLHIDIAYSMLNNYETIEEAKIQCEMASDVLKIGLDIAPSNEILLDIKFKVDSLERTLFYK